MTLQVRLASHIDLSNPLVDEVKQNYSDVFFMTKEILANMEAFSRATISDDELVYVCLHFLAAIERRKQNHKYSLMASWATGFGAAQMLRNRLESELGNRIEVVDVIGYYELNQEKIDGIDFIVSAVDLSTLYFHIPVFTVSVFLKSEEISQIRHAMNQMQVSRIRKRSEVAPIEDDNFKQYCSHDNFFLWTNGDTPRLLVEMAESLSVDESVDFKQSLLYEIKQREELSSVVFSKRVAVPHPIRPLGKEVKVSVAICQEPVSWDSQSSHIQLVFLLSPSLYGNDGLKDVTKKIVSLTENDDLQKQLIKCKDFDEFITIFEKIT